MSPQPARIRFWTVVAVVLCLVGCNSKRPTVRKPLKPTPFTYPWSVIKPGACQGVALMDDASAGLHGIPEVVGQPRVTRGGSIAFYVLAPEGTPPAANPADARSETPRPYSAKSPRAFLIGKDGRKLEVEVWGGFPNRRAMEVLIPHQYPRGEESADLEVVLPGGDPTRFHLSLPPRDDLPLAPLPKPSTVFRHGGLELTGEAWCEPPRAADELSLAGITLRAQGKDDPLTIYELKEWSWNYPDRQVGPDGPDSVFGLVTAGRSWAVGYARTRPWLSDPPIVRCSGTVSRCLALAEPLDFGTLPIEPIRFEHHRYDHFYTITGGPVTVRTKSGLRVTLLPRTKLNVVPYPDVPTASAELVVSVRVEPPATEGLPHEFRDAGRQVLLELGREDVRGLVRYHLAEFSLSGGAFESIGILQAASSSTVKFWVRRKVVVEDTLFDLSLPVRRDIRTDLGKSWPFGRRWERSDFFDPALVHGLLQDVSVGPTNRRGKPD